MTAASPDKGLAKPVRCDRRGAVTVIRRFREILFPTLVVVIIASLWAVGRCQEMEDEIRGGVGPSPRWTALVDYSSRASAD